MKTVGKFLRSGALQNPKINQRSENIGSVG